MAEDTLDYFDDLEDPSEISEGIHDYLTWFRNDGLPPLRGKFSEVRVKLRNNQILVGYSREFDWNSYENPYDIIYWKYVE